MNMKHKLTYMLIGCLFTLAGTVISNLTNIPTQAQDDKVIDEIVCKTLRIVNDEGKQLVGIGSVVGGKGGFLDIGNANEKRLLSIRSSVDGKVGLVRTFNADANLLVGIRAVEGRRNDGLINIYNHKGEWRSYKGD